jgi:hypothetical protein
MPIEEPWEGEAPAEPSGIREVATKRLGRSLALPNFFTAHVS